MFQLNLVLILNVVFLKWTYRILIHFVLWFWDYMKICQKLVEKFNMFNWQKITITEQWLLLQHTAKYRQISDIMFVCSYQKVTVHKLCSLVHFIFIHFTKFVLKFNVYFVSVKVFYFYIDYDLSEINLCLKFKNVYW